MDKGKAKKAVEKSETRKQIVNAAMASQVAQMSGIDPEVQSPQIDMQPSDGFVNPYRALGTMAPTMYSPGNILNGYNFPQMLNPEA